MIDDKSTQKKSLPPATLACLRQRFFHELKLPTHHRPRRRRDERQNHGRATAATSRPDAHTSDRQRAAPRSGRRRKPNQRPRPRAYTVGSGAQRRTRSGRRAADRRQNTTTDGQRGRGAQKTGRRTEPQRDTNAATERGGDEARERRNTRNAARTRARRAQRQLREAGER